MDREKREENKKIIKRMTRNESIPEPFIFDLGEIPEAEMMDYDNEKAQIIMYSKWDRIKEWLKKIWR